MGAYSVRSLWESPPRPFEQTTAPPAPDYDQPASWLAYPGRNGLERSTPPGDRAVDESRAIADVFFIHPTTYLRNDVYNAAVAAPTQYGDAVLLNQASTFNGCCRIYAPRYRQAALKALKGSRAAVDLAYSDVARAFDWYIAHENHDRPFIIASHSQGSAHAIRLLQERILGTPLQNLLVASFVLGAYVPSDFADVGLPPCDAPAKTDCIIAWNANQSGRMGALKLTTHASYWWRGAVRSENQPLALCVNPLNWSEAQAAPASDNLGSLPLPRRSNGPQVAITLPPLVAHLTGAACRDGVLDVDVAFFNSEFHDPLSRLYGSYHVIDYGLFYENIRRNAILRVDAWADTQPADAH